MTIQLNRSKRIPPCKVEGQWRVSLSNEDDGVTATEAELPADLQHLTEAQLMAVTVDFNRNVFSAHRIFKGRWAARSKADASF